MLASAKIAIEHVNLRDDILPGYRLNLVWNDTLCNPGRGIKAMYDSLYTPPTKIILMGAACSPVSEATAQASHLWNLVQFSYVSLSPALSDKARFPRFFRTTAPDVVVNPARIDIFKQFGWTKISTIHQSFELFAAVTDNLNILLKEANVTVVRSEIFTDNPSLQVKNLKINDARIIVGGFYVDKARQIFCEAYKIGLYGRKFLWILVGWYDDNWWMTPDPNIDCTPAQLAEAIEGYIAVDHIYLNPKDSPSVSGIKPSEFLDIFNNRTNNEDLFGKKLSPLAYDTVWTISLGLNETLTELMNNGKYQTSNKMFILHQIL
ncbi:gamma-aminobutyric acid type B receptor subunit 1 [Patella vulgata]|uniref:gamma-aminobutyric acid type B receptor subunit 1 n=1 Tax=Patella vulgata TaxID=6465 RepID=UPI0024A843DD|nr:gamma-aminobutyric acid type B receptor subunit 1 [Patella vulgata]